MLALSAATRPVVAEEPGLPVALADLLAEALRNHPEVLRAAHTVQAAEEVPSRAGSLPDPMISASLQNVPFDDPALDASPMAGVLISLSQALPFPGKRGRRADVARAMAATAGREADLVRAQVALGVRQAYWRLAFAERAYEITSDSERVINSLTDAVHARLSVAGAAQQDALSAQVAHSRVRAMLARRRQEIVSGRRALNASAGRAPDHPVGTVEALPGHAPELDRDQLHRLVREGNPATLTVRARTQSARLSVEEAGRDRLPDFQLGAGYRIRAEVPGDMTRGSDMFVLTAGMSLPVWLEDKQNARLRETRERYREAEQRQAAVELEVLTGLERQLDAVARLDEEIQVTEREILPQADQALDASITDYQFGRVGFVSVLRNWQVQLDAELEHARLLAERAERSAMLEYLAGGPAGAIK